MLAQNSQAQSQYEYHTKDTSTTSGIATVSK